MTNQPPDRPAESGRGIRPRSTLRAWCCLVFAVVAAAFLLKALATGTFENAMRFGTVDFAERPFAFLFLAFVHVFACVVLGSIGRHALKRQAPD